MLDRIIKTISFSSRLLFTCYFISVRICHKCESNKNKKLFAKIQQLFLIKIGENRIILFPNIIKEHSQLDSVGK